MTIVNKSKLSVLVGVSEETLTRWQKLGLPIAYRAERGYSHQYETGDVIAWIIEHKVGKVRDETPKDRLSRLQGDKVEIEIAEKLDNLVPANEVKPAWDAMVTSARAYLQPQADRIAQLVEATEGLDAKRDLLAEEFDDILRHLSEYEPPEETDQHETNLTQRK